MKYILELEDDPNKEYFGEGNYYRCKQIPYWSISESMRNRLEPYDEADRKTEPTVSKMEQVEDEPQTELVNDSPILVKDLVDLEVRYIHDQRALDRWMNLIHMTRNV